MIDDIAALIQAQYVTGYVMPCITEGSEYINKSGHHISWADMTIDIFPPKRELPMWEMTHREYQRIRRELVKHRMDFIFAEAKRKAAERT